jgi:acyl-CoA thioesterase FadM
MNKFFRLFFTLFAAKYRSKVEILGTSLTPFHCYFNDLDVHRHMTNSVYFSLMDLARVDFMIRTGVKPVLDKNGWYPVVTAEMMSFRRSIKLFQKFTIQSRILGWTDKAFIVEQWFDAGGSTVAKGVIMARFLKIKGGSVMPAEILNAVNFTEPSPILPAHVAAWMRSLPGLNE